MFGAKKQGLRREPFLNCCDQLDRQSNELSFCQCTLFPDYGSNGEPSRKVPVGA